MRRSARFAVVVPAILLAACTAGGGWRPPSQAPQSSPSPQPSQRPVASPAAPSSPAATVGPWLRAWVTQALPPPNAFGLPDALVITSDGVAVAHLSIADIHPRPAVVPLVGRQLTSAGRDQILARARGLGLLSGATQFGAPDLPGAATAHILLTVDGRAMEILGNPNATIMCIKAPCDPAPGTPEAFGEFWRQLANSDLLHDWLGPDVASQQPFQPPVYSVLVGPAPTPDPKLGADVAYWPLPTPIARFGIAVLDGSYRCGTVGGADAGDLAAALARANSLTQWTQSESTSAAFGLVVRPVVEGQDACREIFGIG